MVRDRKGRPILFGRDIGIDLGTANVHVFVRGKDIVISEPSVVAVDQTTNRIMAVGEEARQMIGRTPGNIVATRPLRDGVIADFTYTELMLKYFIRRATGRRPLLRPQIVVCVPSGVTSVEQRAVIEACMQSGAKKVVVISEAMAAAIGAGMDVSLPTGHMVVDLGGGTTDVAVISLGGEVITDSIRLAGDKFDEAITRFVRREFNLLIGERTAEEIKAELGCVFEPEAHRSMSVRGRHAASGLPQSIELSSTQVYEALQEPIQAILNLIRSVLEKTPPELAGDIMERGMVLTGGGALMKGLPELIERDTHVPAIVADEPMLCVVRGTGKVLENIHQLPTDAVGIRVS